MAKRQFIIQERPNGEETWLDHGQHAEGVGVVIVEFISTAEAERHIRKLGEDETYEDTEFRVVCITSSGWKRVPKEPQYEMRKA